MNNKKAACNTAYKIIAPCRILRFIYQPLATIKNRIKKTITMKYQTFEPSLELNGLIKCYWTLEYPKEENPDKQTIVPDGCLEMIFHYGDNYKQYLQNGESIIQPSWCLTP